MTSRYKDEDKVILTGDPVHDTLFSEQTYNQFENWLQAERDKLLTKHVVGKKVLVIPNIENKKFNEYIIPAILTALKEARQMIWVQFEQIRKSSGVWNKLRAWKKRSRWDTLFHTKLLEFNLAENVPTILSEKFDELYLSKNSDFIKAVKAELKEKKN